MEQQRQVTKNWWLTNTDADFEKWRHCELCQVAPAELPTTLPCLHTICFQCLSNHQTTKSEKFKESYPQVDSGTQVIPCPVCGYPCGCLTSYDTNKWMIKLIFRERVAWWREISALKAAEKDNQPSISVPHRDTNSSDCEEAELAKKEEEEPLLTKDAQPEKKSSTGSHEKSGDMEHGAKKAQEALLGDQVGGKTGPERARSEIQGVTQDFQESESESESSKSQGETSESDLATGDTPGVTADDEGATADVLGATADIPGATAGDDGATADIPGVTAGDEGANPDGKGADPDIHDLGATNDDQMATAARCKEAVPDQSSCFSHDDLPAILIWMDKYDEGVMGQQTKLKLMEHWKNLLHERVEPFNNLEGCVPPGSRKLQHLFDFDLRHGSEHFECTQACAIAVNKATGNVMVVDHSLCKGIFFDEKGRPFGHKEFKMPVLDCSFLPMQAVPPFERFCVMGRKKDDFDAPAVLFMGSVNDDHESFYTSDQSNFRDITGFHCYSDDDYFLNMGLENKSFRKCNMGDCKELKPCSNFCFPTHITSGVNDDIIIADSGNHRIAMFKAHDCNDIRFIGKHGHKTAEFFWPLGVAVDKLGRLFVCDANNYRIQVFNADLQFESIPLSHTFRLTSSVSQDVKPIDCAIDIHQHLLVLLCGRKFCTIRCYEYEQPIWCVNPDQDFSDSALSILNYFCCACFGNNARDDNSLGYERCS